ncbi:MAG: YlmH/Sll1252 family protein [Bacillota bacterium]
MLDRVELCLKSHQKQLCDFYDPFFIKLTSDILRGIKGIDFIAWGGYEQAERKKICLVPEGMVIEPEDYEIALVNFQGSFRFFNNNHRHVLGALLASGLRRDKIGDILVTDKACQVLVDDTVTQYLIAEIVSIGPVVVSGKKIPIQDLIVPPIFFKEFRAVVASMRLDAVISVGFGLSRNKSSEEIRKQKVKLNWQEIAQPDCLIEEGDVVSLKGRGRLKVLKILGKTKKDRISLVLGIYT